MSGKGASGRVAHHTRVIWQLPMGTPRESQSAGRRAPRRREWPPAAHPVRVFRPGPAQSHGQAQHFAISRRVEPPRARRPAYPPSPTAATPIPLLPTSVPRKKDTRRPAADSRSIPMPARAPHPRLRPESSVHLAASTWPSRPTPPTRTLAPPPSGPRLPQSARESCNAGVPYVHVLLTAITSSCTLHSLPNQAQPNAMCSAPPHSTCVHLRVSWVLSPKGGASR
jgi:hypothetical protein